MRRRVLGAIAAVALVFVGSVDLAAAGPGFRLTRLFGGDRYLTSANVARNTFASGPNAVVASGDDFPDALAAAYLAGRTVAPVYLTPAHGMPGPVMDVIVGMGAWHVDLIGGPGAVGQEVEDALIARGFDVRRVGGNDRFETAANVARAGGAPKSATALLASGRNFPDALAAGPIAYGAGLPQLLTEVDHVPAATWSAITDLGIRNVIVIGGVEAVSDGVVAEQLSAGGRVEMWLAQHASTLVDGHILGGLSAFWPNRVCPILYGASYPEQRVCDWSI